MHDLERPQGDVLGGAEPAALALDLFRLELGVARHLVGLGHLRPHAELEDAHRRDRGEVVRIEHREQRLGQLGEIVVELEADARVEQRYALDQPCDMRVLDRVGADAQAARDLGIALREVAAFLAQELELGVVVVEQVFHGCRTTG